MSSLVQFSTNLSSWDPFKLVAYTHQTILSILLLNLKWLLSRFLVWWTWKYLSFFMICWT